MVIAIFRSLAGESLEDYSIRLAERWRIGQKGLDNGIILLVFLQERSIRLEVGYGLEPLIPDVVAGQIIREAIAPRFREGRYAAGLEGAVHAVYARLSPGTRPRAAPPPAWPALLAAGFAGFVILALLASVVMGRRHIRAVRSGRRIYTAGPGGWYVPPSAGWGSGGGGLSGGGGFSGGGGSFGGGGASGRW
jgi:uncharacterized protein